MEIDETIAFVIARERSDCSNLLRRAAEIATVASRPRNDTGHSLISLCATTQHRVLDINNDACNSRTPNVSDGLKFAPL